MKVVIVGASYTGIQLARTLADEKSDVVLIDNSPEKVGLARNKIDCTVIQAAGNDIQVLEHDAGISSADALVMLTEDDETNMVTCSLVGMRYPDLLKIARVRNETYYAALPEDKKSDGQNAPLPLGTGVMFNPEVEAAVDGQRDISRRFRRRALSRGKGTLQGHTGAVRRHVRQGFHTRRGVGRMRLEVVVFFRHDCRET